MSYIRAFFKNVPLLLSDTTDIKDLSLARVLLVIAFCVLVCGPVLLVRHNPELMGIMLPYWNGLLSLVIYLASVIVFKKVNPWNPVGLPINPAFTIAPPNPPDMKILVK